MPKPSPFVKALLHPNGEESQTQIRSSRGAEGAGPTGLAMYTLLGMWCACIRKQPAPSLRKWSGMDHASFAEMVAALRVDSLAQIK